jgi:5'(3')-deoxyribonucleotidase
MFDDLNEENFLMYAMKAYTSPHYVMSEFEGDLKRTKYLKRLFRRYKITKSLKERLVLNHLILLYNVFGVEPATRILFFRIDEVDYDVLKTFLTYLNYMPERIKGINGKDILSSDILIDENVLEILKTI